MSFKADIKNNSTLWNYINGNNEMSILVDRWNYLSSLFDKSNYTLKVAFRDIHTNKWTPWEKFPGYGNNLFRRGKREGLYTTQDCGLEPAIDVHRSMLGNEIVIESDYQTYEENYEAAKIIGVILENKGFTPHYYYSGNKSLHIHVFIDWDCLKGVDLGVQDQLRIRFKGSIARFRKSFITWLREKMIMCWDTQLKKFDTDLIKDTHLIRCELSKNKLGFKTFLGYNHKDISFVPYICNENNMIYPSIGKIKLSCPHDINGLLEEFLEYLNNKDIKIRALRKNKKLSKYINTGPQKLRECVRMILSDDFKAVGDGTSRAMFILINEFRQVYGDTIAKELIYDWNSRMNNPINESEI